MIKKYILIIAVLLAILIFTSTSTASFLSSRIICERFPENSAFKKILDRFFQVASNNDDGMSIDTDGDDGEEKDDGKYDDEIDPDGPKEDVLLPETIDLVGEKTPDDGNESVDDSKETLDTIDTPDGDDGGIVWNNGTVDSNGNDGAASNEITIPDYIDKGEWTVDLERVVEIVTERNGKLGAMLQRVIKRTVATDGEGGTAENDIVGHVIATDGEGGTAENDIVGVVVLTDGDQ